MTAPATTDPYELYDHAPINLARWVTGAGDETDAFNSAAEEARATGRGLFMPGGVTVRVDGIVDLRRITNLDLAGIIRVGPEGRVDIGYDSFHRVGAHLRVRRIEQVDRATQNNVILRTSGMKQAHIWVDYCDYWEWYADGEDPSQNSTSYCVAYPGYIRRMDFTCKTGPTTGYEGWITQLTLIGGDIKYIGTSSDGYVMNQITFLGTCLESGEVHLDYAYRWRFIEARCEYNTKFWFGPTTSRIVVEDGFITNPSSVTPGAVLMEDLGTENVITSSFEQHYDRRALFSVDTENIILDGCADVKANLTPGIGSLSARGSFQDVLDTGLIPIRGDSARAGYEGSTQWRLPRLVVSSDTASFRPLWYFYRADGSQVTSPDGITVDGGPSWSTAESRFYYAVNVAASSVVVQNPDVAFIRLVVTSGSPVTPFGRLEVTGYFVGPSSDYPVDLCRRRLKGHLSQPTRPTRGAPIAGTRIQGDGEDWSVVARQETTLSAAYSGGDSVTLSSGTNVAVGDVIGVGMDSGVTHWATVAGLSGTGGRTVLVSPPAQESAAAGAKVVTARWK